MVSLDPVDGGGTAADAAQIDVVFVHGLMGSAEGTWTDTRGGAEPYWPRRLQADLNATVCPARVWVLGYNAPLRQRSEDADIPLGLLRRGQFLWRHCEDRLGGRPIVFVTHSLGGLVVKAMLDDEWARHGHESPLLRNTRAVVFLGTPHQGSGLANLAQTLSLVAARTTTTLGSLLAKALGGPVAGLAGGQVGNFLGKHLFESSETVRELQPRNPELDALMRSYRRIATEQSIQTLSCYETENFNGAIVVDSWSADPGVGDTVAILGANHATLCKPAAGETVDRQVRQVVQRVATRAQRATRRPVFDELAHQVLQDLRGSRFPRLAIFTWEGSTPDGAPARIEDLPANLPDGPERERMNFRRRVSVEFFRLCEARLRQGTYRIEDADAAAAGYSQFDVDKFVLIAWRKHRLESALSDYRGVVEEQCSYVRGTHRPTLTVLYRALDSLDTALVDQLTPAFGKDLRRTRQAIELRATVEELDGDGITRACIDEVITKMQGWQAGR